jgi:hypothetical protein
MGIHSGSYQHQWCPGKPLVANDSANGARQALKGSTDPHKGGAHALRARYLATCLALPAAAAPASQALSAVASLLIILLQLG